MKSNRINSKQVVFITDAYTFPKGMASTQRTRLLSMGLVENGIKATILCVKAIERPPVENVEVRGYFKGAYFEYTAGTTIRPRSFMKRRWLELRGLTVAVFKLITLKAKDEIYCMYLCPTMVMKITPNGFIFRLLALLLRIPLILEIVERPWSLKEHPNYLEKKISPIIGATGVIVITDFLKEWVLAESRRISKKVSMLYIPSMVDPKEATIVSLQVSQEAPKVLFAGSPVYSETIRFIIKSMGFVINRYPNCHLIITGAKKTDPQGAWIQSEKIEQVLQDNIIFVGYVPRDELLTLYKSSNALLIPLFDDVTSKARFPIKLVEYLLSGRPVVTTDVGDITKYLKNACTAFICDPGDPKIFAELIIKALENPAQADEIGERGKNVALEYFDYSLWAKNLSEFIRALK